MELARSDSVANLVAQDEILLVVLRDDHALGAGELTAAQTGSEETLHLVVHPADDLSLTQLIDRTRDREVLPHRQIGQLRDDRDVFRHRCAVALDPTIHLLERDTAVERQREALCEVPHEQTL